MKSSETHPFAPSRLDPQHCTGVQGSSSGKSKLRDLRAQIEVAHNAVLMWDWQQPALRHEAIAIVIGTARHLRRSGDDGRLLVTLTRVESSPPTYIASACLSSDGDRLEKSGPCSSQAGAVAEVLGAYVCDWVLDGCTSTTTADVGQTLVERTKADELLEATEGYHLPPCYKLTSYAARTENARSGEFKTRVVQVGCEHVLRVHYIGHGVEPCVVLRRKGESAEDAYQRAIALAWEEYRRLDVMPDGYRIEPGDGCWEVYDEDDKVRAWAGFRFEAVLRARICAGLERADCWRSESAAYALGGR